MALWLQQAAKKFSKLNAAVLQQLPPFPAVSGVRTPHQLELQQQQQRQHQRRQQQQQRKFATRAAPHWLEGCSRDAAKGREDANERAAAAANREAALQPGSHEDLYEKKEEKEKKETAAAQQLSIHSRRHALVKHFIKLKTKRKYRASCGQMAVLGAETIMEVFGGPGGESGGKKGEKEIRKGEKEMKKGEKEEKELFEELGEAKRKPLVPLVLIENEKSENAESARRGLSGVRTAAGARLRATDEIMKVLCERKSDPFSSKTTNENKIIHKLPFNSAKFHQKSPKSSPNSFSDAAAIFEIPKPADDSVNPRFVLAADGIRYASNLGLLLHLAFFLEIDFLFFVSGGVDPFNWKVISRSKGLHLLLPFAQGPPEALLEFCKKKKLILIAADLQGPPLEELKERISGEACEGICCVLGGESKGPSSLLKDNSLKFALPMAPFVESLNVGVAGGLALSLLRPLALARSFEKFQKKFQDAQKGTF